MGTYRHKYAQSGDGVTFTQCLCGFKGLLNLLFSIAQFSQLQFCGVL